MPDSPTDLSGGMIGVEGQTEDVRLQLAQQTLKHRNYIFLGIAIAAFALIGLFAWYLICRSEPLDNPKLVLLGILAVQPTVLGLALMKFVFRKHKDEGEDERIDDVSPILALAKQLAELVGHYLDKKKN